MTGTCGGKSANPRLLQSLLADPRQEMRQLAKDAMDSVEALTRIRCSELRKEVASKHPMLCGMVYLSGPEWFDLSSPGFHWEMTTLAESSPRTAFAAPTGSGKTVVLTKGLSLYRLLFKPRMREGLIVSASADLASGWLDQIRNKVDTSDEIREDFGDIRGDRWGSTDCEFKFEDKTGRLLARKMVKARGKECAIRGLRPDWAFLDDPQGEMDLKSELQMNNFEEWLKGALLSRFDTDEKYLTYVGTAINELAYICELVDKPLPGWIVKVYSALTDEGESIWASKWSLDFLSRKRAEVGESRFAADYMNSPIKMHRGRMFNATQIQTSERTPQKESDVTMTVDPSFSVGGDEWAITVVEVDRGGTWHVLEAIAENTGIGTLMDAIVKTALAYPRMRGMGIEAGGGAGDAMQYNIDDIVRRKGLRLPPITYLRHSSRLGKVQRIAQLQPLFEAGRIHISPAMTNLRSEIVNYNPNDRAPRDNLLDSLAMHLEVQIPRSPNRIWPVTAEQERHERYMAYMRHRKPRKKPAGKWDKFLLGETYG